MPAGSGQGPRGEAHLLPVTRAQRSAALGIVALYLGVTLALAFTARPQNDEAIYANPGYNLLHSGNMGLTLYPLPDYLPLSAAQRTYFQPPLFFLVTAGFYRIAGFGVMQLRLLSVFFGLVCLCSWYLIVRKLTKSVQPALLATALISIDYFFLLSAAHGRMDIMCVGLGSAGLAVYMFWRESNLPGAVFGGNLLAGAALLVHPSGLVWAAGVLLAMGMLDGRSLSLKLLALGALPYLSAGAVWGSYIVQDVTAFREQMRAALAVNLGSFDYSHLSHSRWLAYLEQEILSRYAAPFGLLGGGSLAGRAKILVLAVYLAGVLGILLSRRLRQHLPLLWLPIFFISGFLLLAEISPSKFNYYLPHTTVILAACAGTFLYKIFDPPRWGPILATTAALAAIQLGGAAALIKRDEFRREFLPELDVIRRNTAPGFTVMSEAEYWFGLQGRTVLVDPALGFHIGRHPDVFVMNSVFRDLHEKQRQSDPAVFQHVQELLDRSRIIYSDSYAQVYRTDSSEVK